jgi:hypothetical protein
MRAAVSKRSSPESRTTVKFGDNAAREVATPVETVPLPPRT